VTLTTLVRGYSVIARLAHDTFYLHTQFGDSCFSQSGDMIEGIEIKNRSCNPDHACFRGGFRGSYDIIKTACV